MRCPQLAVLALVALLAGQAVARDLLQDGLPEGFDSLAGGNPLGSTDTSCSAFSVVKILVTAGRCRGKAKATCKAVADSIDAFEENIKEWWIGDSDGVDQGRVCDGELVKVASQAVANAVARVWADAFVKVECDGQGFACGYSVSDGSAFAVAFAEAIAIAAADAGSDDVNGFCIADVRAIAGALAEAAESARAFACSQDLPRADFEANYASSVVDAIADAFALATAFTCDLDDVALAKSKCFGEGGSAAVPVETVATGDGTATGEQVVACEGNKAECCSPRFDGRRFCNCDDCNGPLRRQTGDGDDRVSWTDRSNEICFCV